MSQKGIWFTGTLVCAAMLVMTADPSRAAARGGGGHGGGGHGGGFHGGGFHGGGWHGGWHGWHGGGWRGHHGFYRGYYGGFYPGWYGLWAYPYYSYGYADYPYYSYGDYPSYGYSESYLDPIYYAPIPAYGSGASDAYGTYAAPATIDNTAHLTVRVPANAQVWVENQPTSQAGAVRDFQSPELTPGRDYTYDIRARWRHACAAAASGTNSPRSSVTIAPSTAGSNAGVATASFAVSGAYWSSTAANSAPCIGNGRAPTGPWARPGSGGKSALERYRRKK